MTYSYKNSQNKWYLGHISRTTILTSYFLIQMVSQCIQLNMFENFRHKWKLLDFCKGCISRFLICLSIFTIYIHIQKYRARIWYGKRAQSNSFEITYDFRKSQKMQDQICNFLLHIQQAIPNNNNNSHFDTDTSDKVKIYFILQLE